MMLGENQASAQPKLGQLFAGLRYLLQTPSFSFGENPASA